MHVTRTTAAEQHRHLASCDTAMAYPATTGLTAPADLQSLSNSSGSNLDLQQANLWLLFVNSTQTVPFVVKSDSVADDGAASLDLRTAPDHMANIRSVLNPAISDLARVFGVTRQAIYKWIKGETEPEADNLARIETLSQVADQFAAAGLQRTTALLKMKAFDGRSLLDLIAADQLMPQHIQKLVVEAQAMQNAYERSGLAKSKAAPTDDWQSSHSIPGTTED